MYALKKEIIMLACDRCHYQWQPRVRNGQPVKCPRCGHRGDSARIYKPKIERVKIRKAEAAEGLAAKTATAPAKPQKEV